MNTHQKSNAFAAAQFVLIAMFAALYFFAPGPLLLRRLPVICDLLCVVGLVLMAAAYMSLREMLQVGPEPRADGRLVTGGPYRRLRHPIYSGIVLIAIGLFLREPAAWIAVATAVVIAFLIVKSRFEEKLLLERYLGYREYMKQTWGLLPGL